MPPIDPVPSAAISQAGTPSGMAAVQARHLMVHCRTTELALGGCAR
jgi:hypothetical protein